MSRLIRFGRGFAVVAAASSAAAAAVAAREDEAAEGLLRSSRALYTFVANTIDYKYSLRSYDKSSEDYFIVRSEVHLRAAKRMLKLCETNRGFYIKAGQFVASLQHMPKEYVATLSRLQDQARPCPFERIEVLLRNEFGSEFSNFYAEFDKEPIAAASLAQVHRATLKDGQEVAVKVQYPGLGQQFKVDISTMGLLSKAIAWLFPDYQFEWIVPEFEKTLLRELDFEQEGKNAERTAKIFHDNAAVKIPWIFWNTTTKRILTMQFMHGFKVDDVKSIEKAGLDPQKVAHVLMEVFAKMIFCDGYVHGDPHPGNILINPHADKKRKGFDLILLDHGLYRELDEGFRSDFCNLWKALILLDPLEMQHAGEHLGAGRHYKYLSVILTGRTLGSTSGLGKGMSGEERKKLKEEVRKFTLGDISQFMEGLSRDFLIVLRTDGLLRSIFNKLGAPQRMHLMVNAKYAVYGLSVQHGESAGLPRKTWISSMIAYLYYVNLRLRLEILELQFTVRDFYAALIHTLSSMLIEMRMYFPSLIHGI